MMLRTTAVDELGLGEVPVLDGDFLCCVCPELHRSLLPSQTGVSMCVIHCKSSKVDARYENGPGRFDHLTSRRVQKFLLFGPISKILRQRVRGGSTISVYPSLYFVDGSLYKCGSTAMQIHAKGSQALTFSNSDGGPHAEFRFLPRWTSFQCRVHSGSGSSESTSSSPSNELGPSSRIGRHLVLVFDLIDFSENIHLARIVSKSGYWIIAKEKDRRQEKHPPLLLPDTSQYLILVDAPRRREKRVNDSLHDSSKETDHSSDDFDESRSNSPLKKSRFPNQSLESSRGVEHPSEPISSCCASPLENLEEENEVIKSCLDSSNDSTRSWSTAILNSVCLSSSPNEEFSNETLPFGAEDWNEYPDLEVGPSSPPLMVPQMSDPFWYPPECECIYFKSNSFLPSNDSPTFLLSSEWDE